MKLELKRMVVDHGTAPGGKRGAESGMFMQRVSKRKL